jgi:hypothetical protein
MNTATWALAGLLLVAGQGGRVPTDLDAINDRLIRIPLNGSDPAARAQLLELQLYVSDNEGRNYTQVSRVTPDQPEFIYNAERDGVYWFSLVLVDKNRVATPSDPLKVPPSRKILVDTVKPLVQLKTVERVGDDVQVNWEIQESYPDLATLKLQYRSGPNGFWAEAPLPLALTGSARFKPTIPGPLTVRLALSDLAKNEGSEQKDLAAPGTVVAAAPPPPMFPQPGASPPPTPAPLMPAPVAPAVVAPPLPTAPIVPPALVPVAPPPPAAPVPPVPVPMAPPATSSGLPTAPVPELNGVVPASMNSAVAVSQLRGPLPQLNVINYTNVTLNYEVSRQGTSGVQKAEVYMTPDEGRTWQRLAEQTSAKPPISAALPGEGVYGLKLVLSSGAGLSKGPPVMGEGPDMRVEVDTTPPAGNFYDPTPLPNRMDTLLLRWQIQDRNLPDAPIVLEYAENGDTGPWASVHPNVASLPNTGTYNWQLPPGFNKYRVYLRLTARDKAGNLHEVRTPNPVLVDLVRPEGRLNGLLTPSPRTSP